MRVEAHQVPERVHQAGLLVEKDQGSRARRRAGTEGLVEIARLREDFGAINSPELEGISLDGRLAVIYSRFDLGNGWEQFPHAYSYGYKDESALQIGTRLPGNPRSNLV